MPRRDLNQLLSDMYGDEHELIAHLSQEIQERGTEKDILSGKLGLPSPHDAMRWHTGEAAREEALRQERRR